MGLQIGVMLIFNKFIVTIDKLPAMISFTVAVGPHTLPHIRVSYHLNTTKCYN